jgi:hypothetical protein
MRRILLVLEDYNELLFLEMLLKKVGFDVESIRSEVSLAEKLMAVSPDLVVSTGDGHKILGTRVAQKVKRKGSLTKLILLYPRTKAQQMQTIENFIADGVQETPLNPREILTAICSLTNVPVEGILTKFERLPLGKENLPESQIVGGRVSMTDDNIVVNGDSVVEGLEGLLKEEFGNHPPKKDPVRMSKYLKYLVNLPPSPVDGFSKQAIQRAVQDIRKNENDPAIKKLDQERKDFVVALFKKD